tara:strand:- start:239 stop:508 length:270 start_codon:yes stop_codon:yes gene_type:complete
VLSPQNDFWLILVKMDEFGVDGAVHDLKVWSGNPVAASLLPGQLITVKGSIADIRVLPGGSVRIVVDARGSTPAGLSPRPNFALSPPLF